MREESLAFLKNLCETVSPSGYEQPAQELFREYVRPYCDRVETDILGCAIGVRNPEGQPRLMLAGHADEIGFIIRFINDEGYLYFAPVGGHDAVVTVGQRVTIRTANGPVAGVIGKKAIHLMTEEERGKVPDLSELWIDIGASSKKEAEELVSLGDPIAYRVPFELLQNDLAVSKAFDNKMAVFLIGETLRLLAGKQIRAGVYGVSTVQEEIGIRGARTSAYHVDPLLGIALDVGHAGDYPAADKKRSGDLAVGKGPMICRGANINPKMFERLAQTAKEIGIPYQIEVAPGGTGTDANAMQLNKGGMATALVAVALRYMHTPCEVISLKDLEHTAQLLAAFVERLTPDMDWTP
ncbi:MAG: M42 family metallopeptidase [Armatimonadetes bacterium]|nr:M42 family metallopeptidase [Armatimonadota bacterium]